MQKTVKEDRSKYIGGSDIPIILGLSPFKSRFQLVLEKAEIMQDHFDGNIYTEYGNIMEDKIRQHINRKRQTNFVEDKLTEGIIRCHVDGFNGDEILEIKTTSKVYKTPQGQRKHYLGYLCQLLFYMYHFDVQKGILAVYKRPKDLNEEFDAENLQVFEISMQDHKKQLRIILDEVNRFVEDIEIANQNILVTESDLGVGLYECNSN